MEKRTIEKYKSMKVVEDCFVADDGSIFSTEEECTKYERLCKKLDSMETARYGRPLDCDYNEDDWKFRWFLVQNEEDLKALEGYYGDLSDFAKEILSDRLVCIAEPDDYRAHLAINRFCHPIDVSVFTVAGQVAMVTDFLKMLRYEVCIKKKQD